MASSTLDPDNLTSGPDRSLGKGHGTGALGPSDTSDSGSDIQGAPSLHDQAERPLEQDVGSEANGVMPDPVDSDFFADSDASGTGERASAGLDEAVVDGDDIGTDHIETLAPETVRHHHPSHRRSGH